jgi:hypothetical protein
MSHRRKPPVAREIEYAIAVAVSCVQERAVARRRVPSDTVE